MSTESERAPERKFTRINADFPMTVILPGHELVVTGSALDLSRGGMRIATNNDLPFGQTVVVRFTLPGEDRELLVYGRIVLSFYDATTKQYAHGVAFTQYSSQDQEAIERYISSGEAG